MGILNRGFDENDYLNDDDGPMFGGAERREERERKLERAKEIASGLVLGTFERDEEIWDLTKRIKDEN